MIDQWTATQVALPFAITRKLINYDNHRGHELSDIYKRAGLFKTHATDAAALIGIPAVYLYVKLGVPAGVISRHIGEIVHEGLTVLSMMPEHWIIKGSAEDMKAGRNMIGVGSDQDRKRRVQELFGIQERRASRFLLVSPDHRVTTTNDITKLYGTPKTGEALHMIIDAHALAMDVHACCPGGIFTLERNKAV